MFDACFLRIVLGLGVCALLPSCGTRSPDTPLYHGTLKTQDNRLVFHSATSADTYAVVSMPEREDINATSGAVKVTAEAHVDFNCHKAGSTACMAIVKFLQIEAE